MTDEPYRPDDDIQHGIDDNPEGDAKKGATIGGLGGAAVGAAAGSMRGPAGAAMGAVAGGTAVAAASGAAVAGIDPIGNENNVPGLGDGVAYDHREDAEYAKTATRHATTTTADQNYN